MTLQLLDKTCDVWLKLPFLIHSLLYKEMYKSLFESKDNLINLISLKSK